MAHEFLWKSIVREQRQRCKEIELCWKGISLVVIVREKIIPAVPVAARSASGAPFTSMRPSWNGCYPSPNRSMSSIHASMSTLHRSSTMSLWIMTEVKAHLKQRLMFGGAENPRNASQATHGSRTLVTKKRLLEISRLGFRSVAAKKGQR